MPYIAHPSFLDPSDLEKSLWRYSEYASFVSMLQRRQLFFCRADCFRDKFEGASPRKVVELRNRQDIKVAFEMGNSEPSEEIIKRNDEARRASQLKLRSLVLISCWHFSQFESEAMWKLYGRENKGIAIVSNYDRLKESLKKNEQKIYAGKVRYIDYDTGVFYHPVEYPVTFDNIITPFIHKRKHFSHEKEYRAISQVWGNDLNPWEYDWEKEESQNGKYFNVDLPVLIEKIVVSPESSEWFKSLVRETMKTYLPEIPVENSIMDEDPLF